MMPNMPQTSTSSRNHFIDQLRAHLLLRTPWMILLAGLLLTFYFHNHAEHLQQLKLRQAFDFQVAKISDGIDNRITGTEQILHGVAGLFVSSKEVDRKEFSTYFNSLQIDNLHPGIQGIGFARALTAQELKKHINDVRADGFPDYTVRPAGERERYSAIVYLEPFNWRNKRALGFDMYSEPTRQGAQAPPPPTRQGAEWGPGKLGDEED